MKAGKKSNTPLGKADNFTRAQAERFTPPPLPEVMPTEHSTGKPKPLAPGEHPTPTHPIPVYTSVPRGRVKGPIFVVPGWKGTKPKGKE